MCAYVLYNQLGLNKGRWWQTEVPNLSRKWKVNQACFFCTSDMYTKDICKCPLTLSNYFFVFSFAPFMHAHLQTLSLTVLPDGLQLLTTNVLTHHQEVNMFGSFLCRKISLPDISLAEQWHLCRQTMEKHCHYIIKLHGHEFEHDIKYCIRLYRQTLYVTEKEILVKYITCLQRGIHAVFFLWYLSFPQSFLNSRGF